MNDAPDWPERCQVLVIGAGPAGSACANGLARAGMEVALVDQHAFPRDKACGDGLIPDAHAALARLGVLDEVMAHAQRARHVGCTGPRGGRVQVPGTLAVLSRRVLDHILLRAAQRAGARLLPPARYEGSVVADGRVVGARLRQGGTERTVRTDWLVLATGATPQALIAAGLCRRRMPSGMALRGYFRHIALADRLTGLEVVWHQRLRPGYGWIFPCGDGVFNIGTGVMHSHRRLTDDDRHVMHGVNLRELLAGFAACHDGARELLSHGTPLGPMKGAPLRCSLEGAHWSAPGVLVTGEAAGTTYSFTGEGIGKALESGLLAAQALVAGRDDGHADDALRARYESALSALKPRFALYDRANRINAHPWLADLVIWRARRSARLVRRMAGVLDESSNPGQLITAKGLWRLFTE
jgi:geranylgeranyl reductase family protein